jgi:hypothetical protein
VRITLERNLDNIYKEEFGKNELLSEARRNGYLTFKEFTLTKKFYTVEGIEITEDESKLEFMYKMKITVETK